MCPLETTMATVVSMWIKTTTLKGLSMPKDKSAGSQRRYQVNYNSSSGDHECMCSILQYRSNCCWDTQTHCFARTFSYAISVLQCLSRQTALGMKQSHLLQDQFCTDVCNTANGAIWLNPWSKHNYSFLPPTLTEIQHVFSTTTTNWNWSRRKDKYTQIPKLLLPLLLWQTTINV